MSPAGAPWAQGLWSLLGFITALGAVALLSLMTTALAADSASAACWFANQLLQETHGCFSVVCWPSETLSRAVAGTESLDK